VAEPIIFISHFVIDPAASGELNGLHAEIAGRLELDKPRTLAFLSYRSPNGMRLTIVHAFADADAMAGHFEGAAERSRRAYELMRPAGWEIYGTPHAAVLDQMREAAAEAGVELTLAPDFVGGFLRLAAS
jgi:hypothetical protein